MIKNSLNIVEGDYLRDGYTIIESHEIGIKINTINKEFTKFKNFFDVNRWRLANIFSFFKLKYAPDAINECASASEFTRNPLTPLLITSSGPPLANAKTGQPQACDSI